jgi:phosphatidylglycerol lysyltransferase
MTNPISTKPAPASDPGTAAARAGRLGTFLRSYLIDAPVSVALAAIILAASIVTGTMWKPFDGGGSTAIWAASTESFGHGRWWTVLTALFIPEDLWQLIVSVLAALVLMYIAERRLGHLKAALAFLVTGVLGVGIGVGILAFGQAMGEELAATSAFDSTMDPTIGVVGALIAASATMNVLWRRRIRLLTFAVVLVFVLYNGDQDNFLRLIAGLLGLPLGLLLRGERELRPWRRSSHRETRTLVALITGITAFGPLVAMLPPGGFGPLSYVTESFSNLTKPNADVFERCRTALTASCNQELSVMAASGIGPFVLSLVPLILLVVAALGLRRGRRFAWLLAIVSNAALAVIAFAELGLADAFDPRLVADAGWEDTLLMLLAFVEPIAMIVLLVLTRRNFELRAPRKAVVRFTITVVASFVVLAAFYLLVAFSELDDYVPQAGGGLVVVDALRRFLPPGLWSLLGTVTVPDSGFAALIYDWIGVIFWILVIVAVFRLYSARVEERTKEGERLFRELLKLGGGTMGFMGTWPGNLYWFTPAKDGAVAYRVINGIAIALSDPVCAPERAETTIVGFVDFCERHSWTPVFYSFHGAFLPVFEGFGWQHMSVGEETLMHPQTFDMVGKPWQKVRQAYNKGVKAGITTLWTTWQELPPALAAEISAISEQWVAEKELPEMGFTLGGMDELKDPEVKLFLALGADGGMQAITSWLPSYADGKVTGWVIDFMRRGDGSMPGIMEFVIASAALRMQTEDVQVLSLSGAPLASKPLKAGEPPAERTAMTGVLEFLAKTLEPAYGFASLFKFKSKFNPTYDTIYMAYPDPVALPAIGAAIGHAYLPDATAKEYLAFARTLTK